MAYPINNRCSSWEALEPNHPDCHDHYFKVNRRWYVYADTPNHFLYEQPIVAGITSINEGEHLDTLLRDLKQLEPFRLDRSVSNNAIALELSR